MNPEEPVAVPPHAGWPRVGVIVLAAVGYLAAAAVATYPVVTSVTTALPGHLSDPLEHLWIMRWTERCLQEGRSPWFCPDAQYPTGVPLGLYPTMHLQTFGYLLLGWLTQSDVLRFNALWAFGFVSTGVTSFLLAWSVTRRVSAAWLGGLGMMLCGPMLMHAHGHLETMQMGAVPLFLLGWLGFVDQPSARRLILAAGLYLLVVASAPYFAVLAIFPAGWYVAWSTWRADRGARWGWLRDRAGWLAGFVGLTVPGLMLLFAPQIWAVAHGYVLARSREQFQWFGAPVWSYFTPTAKHAIGGYLAGDLYQRGGYGGRMFECESYLGVLALALLAYTFGRRVPFARSGYWWSTLVILVVLSWGAKGPFGVTLPAGWLHHVFPPFQLIRVPARFNLFAAAVAVVPVAVGLRDLLDRLRSPGLRSALVAVAAVATVADLAVVPFPTSVIPPMPPVYREIVAKNPGVKILDAPVFRSSQGHVLGSLCGYWQSLHRGRTSAGYSGITNARFDAEIYQPAPWSVRVMADRDVADPPASPAPGVDPHDQAWLFLTAHQFDYLALHQGPMLPANYVRSVAAWKAELAEAKISEDADVAVFDRARLRPPATPVALVGVGWNQVRTGKNASSARFAAGRDLAVTVFNPDASQPVRLALEGVAVQGRSAPARRVRLLDGRGQCLADWNIAAGDPPRDVAATVALPQGISVLTLRADGESPLPRGVGVVGGGVRTASFLFNGVAAGPGPGSIAGRSDQANLPERR